MGKYDKYFIEKSLKLPNPVEKVRRSVVQHAFSVDGEESAGLPGAFLMESQMVVRPTDPTMLRSRPHCHDFDEYMVFASTDPEDISNLGGEVEVWIENERHVITKSTAVFIPKFTMHLPVNMLKVDRPFMWITTANTTKFRIFQYSNAPEFANESARSGLVEITVNDKTYQTTGSYLGFLQWQMEKSRKERGM